MIEENVVNLTAEVIGIAQVIVNIAMSMVYMIAKINVKGTRNANLMKDAF